MTEIFEIYSKDDIDNLVITPLAEKAIDINVLKDKANIPVTDDGYDVFILAGQSNMVGWGTPVLGSDIFDSRVYQFKQDGTIAPAAYPLDHIPTGTNPPGATIGMQHIFTNEYIADGYLKGNRKILLIPCAASGTSFKSGAWTGVNQTKLINQINAVKALASQSNVILFKGVLWHQGESDIIEGNTSTNWKSQLKALIDNVRSNVGFDIPFIMGEWSQSWMSTYPVATDFYTALQQLGNELPNCFVVNSDGLTGDSVNGAIHFSATSQRSLGDRYYNGFKTAKQSLGYVNANGISIDQTSANLNIKDILKLTPTVSPINASNKGVIFISNNPNIATVSADGQITAQSNGSCQIYAVSLDSSFIATCNVTILTNNFTIAGSYSTESLTLVSGTTYTVNISSPTVIYAPAILKNNGKYLTSMTIDVTDKTKNFFVVFGYENDDHYTALNLFNQTGSYMIGYIYDVVGSNNSSGHTALRSTSTPFTSNLITISISISYILTITDTNTGTVIFTMDLSTLNGAFKINRAMGLMVQNTNAPMSWTVIL